jgi:Mn-dependent transcriptional regulator
MTPMKEDYLKIIFELGGTKKRCRISKLTLSLDIAAGSVTEMVGKLVQEGLAKHYPVCWDFVNKERHSLR